MPRTLQFKGILYSIVIVVAGLDIYWHLYTGGWLTNPYYRLNDPDIVNLVLAICRTVPAARCPGLLADHECGAAPNFISGLLFSNS